MKRELLGLAALTLALVAALPGPGPVITVQGAASAAKLSPALRDAIAPQVTALDAALQKAVAARATTPHAAGEPVARPHAALQGVHEECLRLYHEIGAQLDPEQRAAFMAYLHERMKAAGLDPSVLHPGGHIPHSPGD